MLAISVRDRPCSARTLPSSLGLVTVIAVIGILPYISLQLKAVSSSFTILVQYPDIIMATEVDAAPMRQDTALWVALILAAFTIAHRRLIGPGVLGAGVAVIMRYTLRLLTLDQLSRAAGVICALELMRDDPTNAYEPGFITELQARGVFTQMGL